MSESFVPTRKGCKGLSPPIQKVRSAHEGERAESRRGWVLVCDGVGGKSRVELETTGDIKNVYKDWRVPMFRFRLCFQFRIFRVRVFRV